MDKVVWKTVGATFLLFAGATFVALAESEAFAAASLPASWVTSGIGRGSVIASVVLGSWAAADVLEEVRRTGWLIAAVLMCAVVGYSGADNILAGRTPNFWLAFLFMLLLSLGIALGIGLAVSILRTPPLRRRAAAVLAVAATTVPAILAVVELVNG